MCQAVLLWLSAGVCWAVLCCTTAVVIKLIAFSVTQPVRGMWHECFEQHPTVSHHPLANQSYCIWNAITPIEPRVSSAAYTGETELIRSTSLCGSSKLKPFLCRSHSRNVYMSMAPTISSPASVRRSFVIHQMPRYRGGDNYLGIKVKNDVSCLVKEGLNLTILGFNIWLLFSLVNISLTTEHKPLKQW